MALRFGDTAAPSMLLNLLPAPLLLLPKLAAIAAAAAAGQVGYLVRNASAVISAGEASHADDAGSVVDGVDAARGTTQH
jgi:hypothetical protein